MHTSSQFDSNEFLRPHDDAAPRRLPVGYEARRFLERFEAWALDPFLEVEKSVEKQIAGYADLITAARPWVDELRLLFEIGVIWTMTPKAARALSYLWHFVLARIEHQYRVRGLWAADVTLQLYPVDDLLIGLSFVEQGLLPPDDLLFRCEETP